LVVPVAPNAEGAEMLRIVQASVAAMTRVSDFHSVTNRALSSLDQTILAKAFRGELVPQDPSDEPASVLLERLRSSRAS